MSRINTEEYAKRERNAENGKKVRDKERKIRF